MTVAEALEELVPVQEGVVVTMPIQDNTAWMVHVSLHTSKGS